MQEKIFRIEDDWLFVRHRELQGSRPVVLFIHGLGESGMSFREAFESGDMDGFAPVVPDMIGYGRSSGARSGDYCIESQIRRLWHLVDFLHIDSFYVVGHSMGGDIGTFMARSDMHRRIKGLVNVEGDLTPHDIFFSHRAASAAESGRFAEWFEKEFKEETVLKTWGDKWSSCRRYYASLQFARPEAFLANARELYEKNQALPGRRECLTGFSYAALKIPKVFCWGSGSLAKGTLDFLESASLDHRKFEPAFHWPMIDRADRFYAFLSDFIQGPGDASGLHGAGETKEPMT
jgi:pimeloyl-ACP methyl ester carboxylesterase